MCAMDMGWMQMLLGLAICNGRGDWVGWWRWAERGHDRLWCKQGHASLKIVPGLLRTVGADGRRTCPPPHVCTPGDCEAPTGEGASRQLHVQRRHAVPFPQLRCDGNGTAHTGRSQSLSRPSPNPLPGSASHAHVRSCFDAPLPSIVDPIVTQYGCVKQQGCCSTTCWVRPQGHRGGRCERPHTHGQVAENGELVRQRPCHGAAQHCTQHSDCRGRTTPSTTHRSTLTHHGTQRLGDHSCKQVGDKDKQRGERRTLGRNRIPQLYSHTATQPQPHTTTQPV